MQFYNVMKKNEKEAQMVISNLILIQGCNKINHLMSLKTLSFQF